MVVLTYVDDCLFFAKNSKDIDQVIQALQTDTPNHKGLALTVEQDVYAFLGVQINQQDSGAFTLSQPKLILKILSACGMSQCAAKATPCNTEPLGSNTQGDPAAGAFDYPSVVGMLMYLCSNTRPDIQFAVHQCARFTHFPKKTHEQAVICIC